MRPLQVQRVKRGCGCNGPCNGRWSHTSVASEESAGLLTVAQWTLRERLRPLPLNRARGGAELAVGAQRLKFKVLTRGEIWSIGRTGADASVAGVERPMIPFRVLTAS